MVPAKKESPAIWRMRLNDFRDNESAIVEIREAGQGKVVLEREFKMKLLLLLCR